MSVTTQENEKLVKDFQAETRELMDRMELILEQCEGDIRLAPGLEEYGQLVDRIMGGAQSLAMALEGSSLLPCLQKMGNYAGVCKAVGYKTSQLTTHTNFYDVCIAFLQDATEVMREMNDQLLVGCMEFAFDDTFISRLKWISEQFGSGFRSSVAVKESPREGRMGQSEIDELLKKLGL
jgi:hypothetical protein